ncbi:MAG: GH25 family lysozyme [Eubacteriales bacterium]
MDFKRNKTAIVVGVIMVSLVVLVVLLLNYEELTMRNQTVQSQQVEEAEEVLLGETLTSSQLRAFLYDATFFDQEGGYVVDEDEEQQLLLQVTSVEKDLRVKVLDLAGQLVTGESFFVALNGDVTYKDLDQDGMIYIGDLNAGSYQVALMPIDGYQVANSSLNVTVKDQVEYTVIDDISYLIKTESEINASIDDTGEQNAIEESDGTESVNPKFSDVGYTFGIDVSKWNGAIDWEEVAAYGVDFAVIRMGYRGSTTGSLVEDPYFRENVEGAIAAGIKVGLYFFTQATTEVEAVEEASMVASLAREYKIEYPIFIDTESAGGNGRADGLDVETRTMVCDVFCQTIENAGYQAGIYASKNWYENMLNYHELTDYYIWLAQYSAEPTFDEEYHMWQYTSDGSITGIDGRVDLNISYIQ